MLFFKWNMLQVTCHFVLYCYEHNCDILFFVHCDTEVAVDIAVCADESPRYELISRTSVHHQLIVLQFLQNHIVTFSQTMCIINSNTMLLYCYGYVIIFQVPSSNESLAAVAKEFEENWDFLHVLGPMDGKYMQPHTIKQQH